MFKEPFIGKKFETFQQLQIYIDEYGDINDEKFVTESSRNVEDKKLAHLQKSFIRYSCKYGGKRYRNKSGGKRSNTRTYKVNCPAYFQIELSKQGPFLIIKKMCLKHDFHPHAKPFRKYLPEVRRLTPNQRNYFSELLSLGCDKKLLQQKAITDLNKYVSLKDLHNIKYKADDGENLSTALQILMDNGATPRLLVEENKFKALYFSTEKMRRSMKTWPEILFIDGTYKLLKTNLTVMILIVENSNTSSEVVAICLLKNEDYNTFRWMLETFRDENAVACRQMNGIMADKDLLERDCLKEVFGETMPVFVCLWHALKTFHKKITKDEMKITEEERVHSLELIEKMAFNTSENNYNEIYKEFEMTVPQAVLNYYNKNWHSIRHEWALSNMAFGNLQNRTNNRLESLNGKIKQIVSKNSPLVKFIKSLFTFLKSHDLQNDQKTSRTFISIGTENYLEKPVYKQYSQLLTREAFDYVLLELENMSNVNLKENNKKFYVILGDVNFCVTNTSCECSTWRSLLLPCCHIFALRMFLNEALFCEELCSIRWTKKYLMLNHQLIEKSPKPIVDNCSAPNNQFVIIDEISSDFINNIHQREKVTNSLFLELISTCSKSSNSYFDGRIDVLRKLEQLWSKNIKIIVKKKNDIDNVINNIENFNINPTPKKKKAPSVFQKRRIITNITKNLKLIIQNSGIVSEFEQKINVVQEIISHWQQSIEVMVYIKLPAVEEELDITAVKNLKSTPLDTSFSYIQVSTRLTKEPEPVSLEQRLKDLRAPLTISENVQLIPSQISICLPKNPEPVSLEQRLKALRGLSTMPENIQSTSPGAATCVSKQPDPVSLQDRLNILRTPKLSLKDRLKICFPTEEKRSPKNTLNIHHTKISICDSLQINKIKMPISEVVRGRPSKALDTWVRIRQGRSSNAINVQDIEMPISKVAKGRPRGKQLRAIGLRKV